MASGPFELTVKRRYSHDHGVAVRTIHQLLLQRMHDFDVILHRWLESLVKKASEDRGERWITTDCELIGKRVIRSFNGSQIAGRITKWWPPGSSDDEPALYA